MRGVNQNSEGKLHIYMIYKLSFHFTFTVRYARSLSIFVLSPMKLQIRGRIVMLMQRCGKCQSFDGLVALNLAYIKMKTTNQ
jgi:hypothetical protein